MNRRSGGRPGRPRRYVSIDIIRGLYSQGYSFRAISRATGIGYGTVRRAFHGVSPDPEENGDSAAASTGYKSAAGA